MQKNSFRFVNFIALIALSAFSIGVLSSCQPDGCTDPQSDNYDPKAKKDDGSCIPWRDKFVGSYSGNNACAGSAEEVVTIAINHSGASDDGIVISVSGQNLLFTARVTSQNGITIENQEITYKGSTVNISGTGSLKNQSELMINYSLVSGPLTIPCSVTGNQL